MKVIKEYVRAFFVSSEALVWAVALCVFVFFENRIDDLLAVWEPSEDKVMWSASIPIAITVWIISAWKTTLFQDADKQFLLQKWPDFWRLEIVLICGVIHAVIFCLVAVVAVMLPSWTPPSSRAVFYQR
jgi:hypothetical protein